MGRQVTETLKGTLERYLMHFGPADGAGVMAMYEDLADLFEQSAATEPRSAEDTERETTGRCDDDTASPGDPGAGTAGAA